MDMVKEGLFCELRKSELFNQVDERTWQMICAQSEFVELEKGQILFCQDTHAASMHVVLSGQLDVSMTDKNGLQSVIGKIEPFMPVGEIQALTGGNSTATVYADTPSCLIKLSVALIDCIASDAPDTFQKILDIARQRLRNDQLRELLPNVFGSLNKTELDYIEHHIEWIHLSRGEILCRQGDPGDSLYIVVSGRLKAVKEDHNGKKTDLGTIGRREVLGEMALLTGGVRSATLFAQRESYLVKISADLFESLAANHPRAILSIGQTLANRILKSEASPKRPIHQNNLAIVTISPEIDLSGFTKSLARKLAEHVRTLHLNSRQVCADFGMRCLEPVEHENPFAVRLAAWFNDQENHYDLIVYEADQWTSFWTKQCLQNADKLCVLIPGNISVSDLYHEWISFFQEESGESANRTLIFVHSEDTVRPLHSGQWLTAIPANEHYHVVSGNDTDFCRLARRFTGHSFNLVLSGGAACGLAHIGVIRALEECNVPIDSVCGTSMGAVIASQYAMGTNYPDLVRMNRWFWVLSKPMKDLTLPLFSFLSGRKINLAAKEIFQDIHIEDLWLPFFCVSTNLTLASAVIHRRGLLLNAIRASCAVPGLVPPVIQNNEILVDGGIMNNMPVEIARGLFKGKVIAVDVTDARVLSTLRQEFPSPWEIIREQVMQVKNRQSVPGILDIIYRSAVAGSRQNTEKAAQNADLSLRIPLDQFKFLDFDKFDEIVDVGYQYGKKKIQAWKDSWNQ